MTRSFLCYSPSIFRRNHCTSYQNDTILQPVHASRSPVIVQETRDPQLPLHSQPKEKTQQAEEKNSSLVCISLSRRTALLNSLYRARAIFPGWRDTPQKKAHARLVLFAARRPNETLGSRAQPRPQQLLSGAAAKI